MPSVRFLFYHQQHKPFFLENYLQLNILNRIDQALLLEVKEKSKYAFEQLSTASGVESVSGLGLMIGIKTVKPAIDIVKNNKKIIKELEKMVNLKDKNTK